MYKVKSLREHRWFNNLFFPLRVILLFLSFWSLGSQLQAQAYIDCATILTDEYWPDVYDGTSQTIVKDGFVYIAFLAAHGPDEQRFPIINGTDYNISNPYYRDIYFSIFDDNCNQILGTYLGGTNNENFSTIALDTDGNIIITGDSYSTDFPTTDGTSTDDYHRTFIMKYAPDGTLIFSTTLSGTTNLSIPTGLLTDGTDVYVYGQTRSSSFPTTNGTTLLETGVYDVFVAKYDGAGNLLYSTLYGGNPEDAIIINGELYVTAYTTSLKVPTTDGTSFTGGLDIYLMRLDQSGNLVFNTVFGGAAADRFSSLDSDGTHVYLTGRTNSTDFPTTDGSVLAGDYDIFLRKYDLSGNLVYSKLIGGPDFEGIGGIAIVNGELYVYGSSVGGFPVDNGASAGDADILLMKFDAAGNELYSTLYGGSGYDHADHFYVNSAGEVFLMSYTNSNVPTTDGTTITSGYGLIHYKFNSDGSFCAATVLDYDFESISPINNYDTENNTFWSVGIIYADKNAASTDGTQVETLNSSLDVVITKLVLCPDPTPISSDTLSPNSQMVCRNGLVEQIIGEEQVIDGTSFPPVYVDGVLGSQADIVLDYQWQVSASSAGPWTDILGPLGKQKNYSPPPTTVDVYYRRLSKTAECCGGTLLSTSDVASVLVTADVAPTVDAGGTFYTCPSSSVTIGGNPAAIGGTPTYNYSWNEDEFIVATPSVAPIESTIYTLLVTDANGCRQADQAAVVVYSADAGESNAVCDGNAATIGGSPLAGIPIVAAGDTPPANEFSIAYDWTPKDGSLSCTDCPNPLAAPSSETEYTLTTTIHYPDGGSCQTSDIVNVRVIAAPPTTLTIPNTVICLGEEIELGTNPAPIADISISSLSQSSGSPVATIANLTDGDFTTGGNTDDGTDSNITIDLGSPQLINQIYLAALSGRTSDDALRVELSLDNMTFTQVAYYSNGLSATNLTSISFAEQTARYVRLESPFSSRDVSISEFSAIYDYTYIWTPGEYVSTSGANATFDAGNLRMPNNNPITYTLSATLGECTFYEQVTVAVIEARAGEDYCGPRTVGEPDRTPNIEETYTWTKITDPAITTGTGDFLGVTNEDIVPVSASVGGDVGYELMTSYTLDGVTAICRDTVLVPPTCVTGCSIVTNDGGCPSYDNGTPTLVALVPEEDSLNWTYSWTSNAGMLGLDSYTNRTVHLTDNVSRTYTVTFTSIIDPTYTCTASIDANSASFSTPVFDATSPIEVCSGASVNIGNPATNPGLSYVWSSAASLDDPTISYPEATVAVSTDFTVRVTDIVTGCFVVDTVEIEVGSLAAVGKDFTVCDNGIITLGKNNALPGYTYAWEPAAADWRNGTDENDAMPDAFVATTQEFVLTVTSASGCMSTDTVLVTVEPLPPSITLPDLSFCPSQGTALVLGTVDGTATGTNLIPDGYSYTWNPTSVSDLAIQNPTVNVPLPTNSVTYEIEVRATNGCNQKATQTINSAFSQPLVSNDATICLGESIQIGDDANPTAGGITYTWLPAIDLNDATAANPAFTPSAAGTVTYTVTKSDGSCSTTAEVTITTISVSAPILSPQVICAGSSVQIGTDVSDPLLSYQWTPTTGLDNAFIANPTFSGINSTNYTLTVINGNSCVAETNTSVTVNPAPAFTISLPDTTICDVNASSLVINAGVTPSTGTYAYNWSPTEYLSSSNVLTPTFYIPAAGTYEYVLEVIDQSTGCSVFDTTVMNVSYDSNPQITTISADTATCVFQEFMIDVTTTDGNGYDVEFVVFTTEQTDPAIIYDYSNNGGVLVETVTVSGEMASISTSSIAANFSIFSNGGTGNDFYIYAIINRDDSICRNYMDTYWRAHPNPSLLPSSTLSINCFLTEGDEFCNTYTNYTDANGIYFSHHLTIEDAIAGINEITEICSSEERFRVYHRCTYLATGCYVTGYEEFNLTYKSVVTLTDPVDRCASESDMNFVATPIGGTFTTTATSGFTSDGATGTANLDLDVVGSGTYDITYTYTNGDGCTNDSTVTVNVLACDWGDLPDISANTAVNDYQTTSANNGPVHIITSGLSLGSTVDSETDGQPSNNALGDGADEDGLMMFSSFDLYPDLTFRLPFNYVNTTGETAHIEAWIDWNGDGAFDGTDEMVIDWDDSTGALPSIVEITIPQDVLTGLQLGWRIRISNQDNMTPYGLQPNGEIEDYLIGIDCPQVCLPITVTIIPK